MARWELGCRRDRAIHAVFELPEKVRATLLPAYSDEPSASVLVGTVSPPGPLGCDSPTLPVWEIEISAHWHNVTNVTVPIGV